MKKSLLYGAVFIGLVLMVAGCKGSGVQNSGGELKIVPKPVSVKTVNTFFALKENTVIRLQSEDDAVYDAAEYLQKALQEKTGLQLEVLPAGGRPDSRIVLRQVNGDDEIGEEGYRLNVAENELVISGNSAAGIFYGVQTLRQILTRGDDNSWGAPGTEIVDAPRFSWRGMHLDVGRSFFPVSFVKKYIDLIAMHKMNTFHWHLTEDQGWRIEIKKYPLLTEVGAFRDESLIGHYRDKPRTYDGKRYGGFYTQEEVKEVVEYARKRFVNVVPEIEMPGHARAALAAYPELSCTGGPHSVAKLWGVHEDIFCAGNDKTFTLLEDVMTEVLALFPSKFIHVGGDEAPKKRWEACEKCQRRIQENGLKDTHELQSYFIKHFDKFLDERDRRLIGWDEILEGGLAAGATVMSWRGTEGGITAANAGHDVVMTPTTHVYFDYYQSEDQEKEPLAIGGFLPLEKVYGFDPVPENIAADKKHHILGAQGNVWTEYITTPEVVEYMAVPRMTALSEVVWTTVEGRDFADFRKRLDSFLMHLKDNGYNYRQP